MKIDYRRRDGVSQAVRSFVVPADLHARRTSGSPINDYLLDTLGGPG